MRFAQYGSLLTEAYDLDKPEPPEAELDWHRRFIGDSGQPVLALMCGSGRFLVPLAAEGVEIDGVDASPDMLAACRAKLDGHGLHAKLYEQKLQELDVERRYAAAYVGGGGSFGLIVDREEADVALRKIHASLEDGGRFCLEILKPTKAPPLGRPHVRSWVRPDGARIVLTTTAVHFEDNVVEAIGKYELFKDGRLIETELDDFPLRHYEEADVVAMLERAAFTDVVATRAYSDEPPRSDDYMLSFKARK